ncbi:unnamed protein product [Mucor hiemalis]
MCCHINLQYTNQTLLETKRQLLWQSFCRNTNQLCCGNVQFDNYGICMDPNCQFIGCGDIFFEPEAYPGHLRTHYSQSKHNIVLKLSPLNFMEIWCYACDSPIGFWGLPKMEKPSSEKYICREILKVLTQLPLTTKDSLQVIQRRRLIEQRLSVFQYNHDYTHLIEKSWFTSWVDFLIGKSDKLPLSLDNSKLFNSNNQLRHDLIIGVDYELVGSSIRAYIERVYGTSNQSIIVSGDDFTGQPKYRAVSQSIQLHRNFTLHRN